MALHKRTVKAGAVLEWEYYNISPRVKNLRRAEPKPPPVRTPEEQEEFNRRQSLKRFIRTVNANFGPWAYYVTLTFDVAHLPDTFAEARRLLCNYVRRLQYTFPGLLLVAGMGRGQKTGRIHFHLIIGGATKRAICDKWNMGKVKKAVRLRKNNIYNGLDCGRDYTGLATYIFDHWTPEQGGKRWKQTTNLQPPTKYKPLPSKKEYSAENPPPAPKGYRLIRTHDADAAGPYLCFTYALLDDIPDIPYQCTGAGPPANSSGDAPRHQPQGEDPT